MVLQFCVPVKVDLDFWLANFQIPGTLGLGINLKCFFHEEACL